MVRRLVVIACCLVVCGAPLADSMCYSRCAASEASGTHHSCAPERHDANTITAAPHVCATGDEAISQSLEVRHTIVLALAPSVPLDPSVPMVRFASNARSHATGFSPQLITPLRL